MPKETKSNGQKDKLDRFYTSSATVKECLSQLDLTAFNCIIEPSAGNGSFSNQIPECYAYDLVPASEDVIAADWFQLDKTQFSEKKPVLIVGNPPFGQQNSLAIRFFNEAAKFADCIAFILPLSFRKVSVQNRLSLDFALVKEVVLQNTTFTLFTNEEIEVPCVFQIWKRIKTPRKKIFLKTTSHLFEFCTPNKADFRIQRVGGNAGKASFDLDRAVSSNYFVKNLSNKTNEDFINYINDLVFPTIAFTVGPKSLSKGELVLIIEENW